MIPGDEKELAQLHQTLFGEIKETTFSFYQHIEREKTQVLVAIESISPFKYAILGYALFGTEDKLCELNWMGVTSGNREKGVGSTLIDAVIEATKRQKTESLIVFGRDRFPAAVRLYLRKNFKTIGTFRGLDGDQMTKFQLSL